MKQFSAIILLLSMGMTATTQGLSFSDHSDQKQLDLVYNGKTITAYCWYDSSRKPILYPVKTVDGVTVTRSYPFMMIPGERTDHPHHTGIWLNYESVNGLDFWNNSTAIAPEKRNLYGTIVHQQIANKFAKGDRATFTATATWIRPDKKVLLNEKTTFNFQVVKNDFIIDRITTLTATDTVVVFKDAKDGMFAIRVARELELPSKEKSSFVDDKGNVTVVPPSGAGVTGNYISSNGLQGDSVWSSKGNWVMLTGKKDGKNITIGMFDHRQNVGYPAYWHARGYGLFAVNPLGRKIFSNGKEELNFSLQPGQSTTFRYRIVIHSGDTLTGDDMSRLFEDFSKVK